MSKKQMRRTVEVRRERECDGTNEWVHPSHCHNKDITALLPVCEIRSIVYCTDEEDRKKTERGRHKNSIKTLRSWFPASKRRSTHFYWRWMLIGKQAHDGKPVGRWEREPVDYLSLHCLALNMLMSNEISTKPSIWHQWNIQKGNISKHRWTQKRPVGYFHT